jgi:hypothetical protein
MTHDQKLADAERENRNLRLELERLRAALEIVARGDDGMDSYTAMGMQDIARKAIGVHD